MVVWVCVWGSMWLCVVVYVCNVWMCVYWEYGRVVVWWCGCVVVWLCGCVLREVVCLCGAVVWLCGLLVV